MGLCADGWVERRGVESDSLDTTNREGSANGGGGGGDLWGETGRWILESSGEVKRWRVTAQGFEGKAGEFRRSSRRGYWGECVETGCEKGVLPTIISEAPSDDRAGAEEGWEPDRRLGGREGGGREQVTDCAGGDSGRVCEAEDAWG